MIVHGYVLLSFSLLLVQGCTLKLRINGRSLQGVNKEIQYTYILLVAGILKQKEKETNLIFIMLTPDD